jgi:hypothetical protein
MNYDVIMDLFILNRRPMTSLVTTLCLALTNTKIIVESGILVPRYHARLMGKEPHQVFRGRGAV